MPFVSEVGDAVQTSGEMTVEWKISDFFSLSDKVDDFYNSPVFSFAEVEWYLRLYPNGETAHSSSGYVGLYLMRGNSGPSKTVHYTFGIKSSDKVEKDEEKKYEFLTEGRGYDTPEWWLRTDLKNRKSTLLPNDVLTVTCDLRSDSICSVKVSSCNRNCKIRNNMKTILAGGKRADFALKLGDREWPVHKVILESRCEYFENMFRHDWVENTVGEVTFDDMEEETLDSVLEFVYTGAVEEMSVKNVCEIYVAAHKFLLDDLKVQCVEYMNGNMCVEKICKVLVIADTYEEKGLNEKAIDYFMKETGKILDTEEWKQLKKTHLSIVAETLEEATKRKLQKQSK